MSRLSSVVERESDDQEEPKLDSSEVRLHERPVSARLGEVGSEKLAYRDGKRSLKSVPTIFGAVRRNHCRARRV